MNSTQSQQRHTPPVQKLSLADLASVASMVDPLRTRDPCLFKGGGAGTAAVQEVPPKPFSQQQKRLLQLQQQRVCLGGNRQVQFHEARVVGTVLPCSQMSQDEREAIWYNNSALDKFKCQVRSMCRKLREVSQAAASSQAPSQQQHQQHQHQQEPGATTTPLLAPPLSPSASDAPSSRGLEHRVCRKRLRNKQLALRCVLKAQTRSSCPDFIANVSSKCTFWAKEIARGEGARDYAAAWKDGEDNELNASVASMGISPSTASSSSGGNGGGDGIFAAAAKAKHHCPIMKRLCPAKRNCCDPEPCARQVRRKLPSCGFGGNFVGGTCKIKRAFVNRSKTTEDGPC